MVSSLAIGSPLCFLLLRKQQHISSARRARSSAPTTEQTTIIAVRAVELRPVLTAAAAAGVGEDVPDEVIADVELTDVAETAVDAGCDDVEVASVEAVVVEGGGGNCVASD